MKSRFAAKFTRRSGILELMDDLGRALEEAREDVCMLGGGNPALIPEMNAVWRRRTEELLADGSTFEETLALYDTPQGKGSFLEALAAFLKRTYGWDLGPENIAVTNGSQSAFFLLFNLLGGTGPDGRFHRILLPLSPEYIGYADQTVEEGVFVSRPAEIREGKDDSFKYYVDFDRLDIGPDVAALAVSRPTNPTGNVLTDDEIRRLADQAAARDIPLLIDNAYGAPFPGILFEDVTPFWRPGIILGLSLSKLGLPAARTGILVADPEVIRAVSAANAVVSLANGSLGQVLVRPLLESGEIIRLSRDVIRPFYEERSLRAREWIRESFGDDIDYRVHRSEGALFLWIWFRNLKVDTAELYRRLKERGVIVVPGKFFFFGLEEPWPHRDECIRINYALDPDMVRRGIGLIAEEARKVLK